jgi:hypothetical protein
MNITPNSVGYPTSDENRIEKILSTIKPVPGDGFHEKMLSAPWQAGRIQQGKSTMKTKIAFSAIALLLLLVATIVFVPPVRAQVSEWFSIVIHDPNTGSSVGVGGDKPMTYQVMQPGYLPKELSNGRTIAKFDKVTEILYKNDDKFLVLTQMELIDGDSLPEGEVTTVHGQPAVLNKGISGSYQELPEDMQPSASGSIAITDGTDSELIQAPTIEPITFDYTGAVKLTFITGNTKIELLSNLPVDEILKIAAELKPADH